MFFRLLLHFSHCDSPFRVGTLSSLLDDPSLTSFRLISCPISPIVTRVELSSRAPGSFTSQLRIRWGIATQFLPSTPPIRPQAFHPGTMGLFPSQAGTAKAPTSPNYFNCDSGLLPS